MPTPTNQRLKRVLAAVAWGGVSTVAVAADPAARAPNTPSGRAPGDKQHPVPPQYNPSINDAAVVVQKSGASLLKAQLMTLPPEPPDSRRVRDVSFFALPDPEPRTIRKHDLVTVIIREESAFSVQGSTDTKRESTLDAGIDEFIKLRLRNFELEGGGIGPVAPRVRADGNREFQGEGTVDRVDSLTARITAEVVDVKPNGTLVLQARKTIKTDDEEQQLILTGTSRVEDVTADNSVLSTQLYDLRLEKVHKGTVRAATRRSWLAQVLDAISPF